MVDGESGYAMVERFRYDDTRPYPGKASVIFWTNGAQLHQHPDGTTTFGAGEEDPPAIHMEAEVNSPMVRLIQASLIISTPSGFPVGPAPVFKALAMQV